MIIRSLSLAVEAGEAVAIMGPSGSGKSTLLNILGALEPPSGGTVLIAGENPYALDETHLAAFRNQRVGFVFQEHHLLPQCTVLENVLLPTLAGHHQADGAEHSRRLLEEVGLADRMDHGPSELSGGERQRVAIARALIQDPKVVLADEPTGNLDAATSQRVIDLLLALHAASHSAMIVVTHNDKIARQFDKRFQLDDGRLQEL